ncbi:hypothetical protein CHS0354_034856 [Potamilus streckersoni]|uniref:RING-type domain-containing protein n=1 Tax=Potamilus streckersoni TaxID=2493646 RepID=A0AAE0TJC3_9BIVA|nr:hypothetical protein CHS0354_034856 [Potamilus streckersoni]
MAAEENARSNKSATISFTLPISCQICLGKVKQPVLCPNNHVFCSQCLDVWLLRNKHCPACRVSVTAPKQIVGGLSQIDDDTEKLTNPELRKARFELLYKDYENELERLQTEIHLLKTENQILKQQNPDVAGSSKSSASKGEKSVTKTQDTVGLLLLTKKLQDAAKISEKVKAELSRVKRENNNLKDENQTLNRENQNLRNEIANRSPQRFGRYTVSTMESKIQSYEKEVKQLNKALERSDKYIEEMEKELKELKNKDKYSTSYSSVPATTSTTLADRYSSQDNAEVRVQKDYRSSTESRVSSSEYGVGPGHPTKRQLFSDDLQRPSSPSKYRDVVSVEEKDHPSIRYRDNATSSGEQSKYYYNNHREEEDERDLRHHDDYKSDRNQDDAKGGNSKKRVTFDLPKDGIATTSFDLEMPSPINPVANKSSTDGRGSPIKGVLKNSKKPESSASDSLDLPKPHSLDNLSSDLSRSKDSTLTDSYSHQTNRYSRVDDELYVKSKTSSSLNQHDYNQDTHHPKSKSSGYSADDSELSGPSNLDLSFKRSKEKPSYTRSKNNDLDDTQIIESELDDLNISMTPDFRDCMKLLNRAEKKVNKVSSFEDDLFDSKSSDADYKAQTEGSKYKPSADLDYGVPGDRTKYKTNDAGIHASTGSAKYSSNGDFGSGLKLTDNFAKSKFSTDYDTYSRARHLRSGSLDNLVRDITRDDNQYKSTSGSSSSANNYRAPSPSVQTKYNFTSANGGMVRSPSVDNLLLSKPGSGSSLSRYSSLDDVGGYKSSRISLPSYSGSSAGKYPGENNEDFLGAKQNVDGDGLGSKDIAHSPRQRSVSDIGTSVSSLGSGSGKGFDTRERQLPLPPSSISNLPPSGASLTSSAFLTDINSKTQQRDVTHKPPLSSRTLDTTGSLSRLSASGTSISTTGTSSTQHLPMPYVGSGSRSSLYTNTQVLDSLTSTLPSKPKIDTTSLSKQSGLGFTSGHSDISSAIRTRTLSADGISFSATKPRVLSAEFEKYVSGVSNNSTSHSTYQYNSHETDFNMNSEFSDKTSLNDFKSNAAARSNTYALSLTGSTASSQPLDSFPASRSLGPSSSSTGSSRGFDSYSSSSLPISSTSRQTVPSYSSSSTSATSYMPSSMASMTSSLTYSSATQPSKYSTSNSVPFTLASTASSRSTNGYSSSVKYLDSIPETNHTGHFSYVSNSSGADFSSKQMDSLMLPEPKKRLFDSSDDLDVSVSPIKATRKL